MPGGSDRPAFSACTYALVPDAVVARMIGEGVGTRAAAVLVYMLSKTYCTGEMAPLSAKDLTPLSGGYLTSRRVTAAMSDLRKAGMLTPVLVKRRDGSLVEDRSQRGHVACYRLCDDLWDKVAAGNKRAPENGTYSVAPSIGDLTKRHRPIKRDYVSYSDGTYIAVPHALLRELLGREVGMNGAHTLLCLLKWVDKRGQCQTFAVEDIEDYYGLDPRQHEAGIRDLKGEGLISPITVTLPDGSKVEDRAYYGHPITYRICADVWERVSQDDGATSRAVKRPPTTNDVFSRWPDVERGDLRECGDRLVAGTLY